MAEKQQHTRLLRPPIVTILGHVDHGKTTLLDTLRKTKVADREAGGITQSIGASVVKTKDGRDITFIDTPGHAVFNNMRRRGAKLADVVVLVVAADDGVKPQTKEAIKYIKETGVPYLVAITKTDLPNASTERCKASLLENEVLLEGLGGDIPFVPVSAVKGDGLDELLDIISLVGDMQELEDNRGDTLAANVIETAKGKQGALVSVVVTSGTLKKGDELQSEGIIGKARGLFDENGKGVTSVLPGYPVQILGFPELPSVGSLVIEKGVTVAPTKSKEESTHMPQDALLTVLLKAGSIGSLEALQTHLPESVAIVGASVGEMNDKDIFLAKASGARILAFETKIPGAVKNLARTEGVIIDTFDIIYKLFEHVDTLLKEGEVVVRGKAEIQAIFPYNKQKVAGCKVLEGEIKKTDKIHIMREDKLLGETKISSMRKEKKEIGVVKTGEEFGVMISPFLDFKVGDVILSVT